MNKCIIILKQVIYILSRSERKTLSLLFLLMTIGMLFEMASIGLILPIFTIITMPEKLLAYPGTQQLYEIVIQIDEKSLIFNCLVIILIFSVIKFLLLTCLSYVQSKLTYDILSGVSSRIFEGYLKAPYAFHLNNNSSKLVRNAVTEVQVFAQNFINPALTFLTEFFVSLGIMAVLLIMNPKGTLLVILFSCIVGFFFIRTTRRLSRKWGDARQLHEGERIKYIQEGLSCVKEIILLNRAKFFADNYAHEAQMSSNVAAKQVFVGQMPRLILEFIAIIAICLVIWVNIKDGAELKDLLPVLIMFAAAAFRLMPSINRILGSINSLYYSYPSLKALTETRFDFDGNLQLVNERNLNKFDTLELKNIEFSYSLLSGKVITNISLSIKKGEMIGFVGETGSGKSTLLDLMLGLLKPSMGKILVNGADMNEQWSYWRSNIGYVPQTITLIDDTIRKNIAFGLPEADIDDQKVAQALKIAQLDTFIEQLPLGVESYVGERGVRLSGGQRQRIGIARALYHQPEVIFFDEATSALDNQTEAELMQSIEALHGNFTLVMIAHRLSSLMNCDRIYRLDKGLVIESGTPLEILS